VVSSSFKRRSVLISKVKTFPPRVVKVVLGAQVHSIERVEPASRREVVAVTKSQVPPRKEHLTSEILALLKSHVLSDEMSLVTESLQMLREQCKVGEQSRRFPGLNYSILK
jgi:hypothetical protein